MSEWHLKNKLKVGGKFLTVEGSENLETEGGYAKASVNLKETRRIIIRNIKN